MLIIGGTGETGAWFATYFKDHGYDVSVWGPSSKFDVAAKLKVRYAGDLLEEVESCDVVLLSVPIERTVEMIKKVASHMQSGSLLMDVTSLKSEVMRAMAQYAPGDVELLGTHPMFGPTMPSISGQTMILVPQRCNRWLQIMQTIFEEDGARVEIMDPDEHDHTMAVVQALTHFAYISIGSSLTALNFDVAKSRRFMSPVYEIMIDFVGRILAQNPELYASIQANPKASEVRETYINQCSTLAAQIDNGDLEGFMDMMRKAAKHFGDTEGALERSDRLINLRIGERER